MYIYGVIYNPVYIYVNVPGVSSNECEIYKCRIALLDETEAETYYYFHNINLKIQLLVTAQRLD